MLHLLKPTVVFSICLALCTTAAAQTEFPKEFIAHLRLGTGLIAVRSAPEYFVGTLQVVPQYTIIPYRLRGGVIAGGFYSARKVHGLFGATASYKLTEFKGGYFGSLGNVHLTAEHLWGTAHQRLAGGGMHLDLLNRIVIGVTAHRDYHFNNWWWQSGLALRISKVKKDPETFPN